MNMWVGYKGKKKKSYKDYSRYIKKNAVEIIYNLLIFSYPLKIISGLYWKYFVPHNVNLIVYFFFYKLFIY